MGTMPSLFGVLLLISLNCGITVRHGCRNRDTCADNRKKNIPLCYCDQDCLHYGDCCKEYIPEVDFDSVKQNTTREHCVLLTNEKYLVAERVGAYMIDSCNVSSIPCTLREKDLKSMLPVSAGEDTYINDACAICNGVSKFRYWTAVFGNTDENFLFQISR